MRLYRIDQEIVATKGALNVGEELVPNTTDAAGEKHVPVIEANEEEVTVTIGTVEHPMLEAHYIQWIILETERGWLKTELKPGEKPRAVFSVKDRPVAAYEYCNLHGLWRAEA